MTSFIEEEKVTAALEAGASGYVLKDAEAEEVAAAVRAAYAGEVHLDPAVARLLAQRMRNRKSPDDELARAADRAREGRPEAARPGDEQQGDRDRAVHHRAHRADLRLEHPRQARLSPRGRRPRSTRSNTSWSSRPSALRRRGREAHGPTAIS